MQARARRLVAALVFSAVALAGAGPARAQAPADRSLATAFGQERPQGALVSEVADGSPAAAAGLAAGDIITAYNCTPIERTGDLLGHLSLAAPGERIRLGLWRARGAGELTLRLGEASVDEEPNDPGGADAQGELDWRLRPLTKRERESLGLSRGVWVDEVGHFSAQAGLLAGDVLLSINLKPVRSVQEVLAAVSVRPSDLALLIDRDGMRLFIAMWLE